MTSKLPEGWKKVELEKVCKSISERPDKNFKKVVTINTSDVLDGEVLNHEAIINEKLPGQFIKAFCKNDILFSEIRPINKRNAFINFNSYGYVASSKLMVLRTDESLIKPIFFYYYITSKMTLEYLQLLAETRSGTFPQIRYTEIKSLDLRLPSLKEQSYIIEYIKMLDDKIELNNKINENLEKQAQAIFKHWFIDFEFPDKNGNPYKSSGGEMIESELGMIPKGWEVIKLGDIIEICNGKRPRTKYDDRNQEAMYSILGASGVMGYTNEFLYNEPILVIGRVGTHGVVQKINNKVWTSDNTMVIKSGYYELVNIILLNMDYKSLNRGSTQPLLAQKDIKNQKIILGSEKIMQNFEKVIGIFNNKINANYKQIQALSQLRDTLLPKLMSGEIRIPLD